MDAYDIQQQLKQAWGNIFMQQSRADTLTKHSGVPVYVIQADGTEKTVVDIKVQDNRIYLELK